MEGQKSKSGTAVGGDADTKPVTTNSTTSVPLTARPGQSGASNSGTGQLNSASRIKILNHRIAPTSSGPNQWYGIGECSGTRSFNSGSGPQAIGIRQPTVRQNAYGAGPTACGAGYFPNAMGHLPNGTGYLPSETGYLSSNGTGYVPNGIRHLPNGAGNLPNGMGHWQSGMEHIVYQTGQNEMGQQRNTEMGQTANGMVYGPGQLSRPISYQEAPVTGLYRPPLQAVVHSLNALNHRRHDNGQQPITGMRQPANGMVNETGQFEQLNNVTVQSGVGYSATGTGQPTSGIGQTSSGIYQATSGMEQSGNGMGQPANAAEYGSLGTEVPVYDTTDTTYGTETRNYYGMGYENNPSGTDPYVYSAGGMGQNYPQEPPYPYYGFETAYPNGCGYSYAAPNYSYGVPYGYYTNYGIAQPSYNVATACPILQPLYRIRTGISYPSRIFIRTRPAGGHCGSYKLIYELKTISCPGCSAQMPYNELCGNASVNQGYAPFPAQTRQQPHLYPYPYEPATSVSFDDYESTGPLNDPPSSAGTQPPESNEQPGNEQASSLNKKEVCTSCKAEIPKNTLSENPPLTDDSDSNDSEEDSSDSDDSEGDDVTPAVNQVVESKQSADPVKSFEQNSKKKSDAEKESIVKNASPASPTEKLPVLSGAIRGKGVNINKEQAVKLEEKNPIGRGKVMHNTGIRHKTKTCDIEKSGSTNTGCGTKNGPGPGAKNIPEPSVGPGAKNDLEQKESALIPTESLRDIAIDVLMGNTPDIIHDTQNQGQEAEKKGTGRTYSGVYKYNVCKQEPLSHCQKHVKKTEAEKEIPSSNEREGATTSETQKPQEIKTESKDKPSSKELVRESVKHKKILQLEKELEHFIKKDFTKLTNFVVEGQSPLNLSCQSYGGLPWLDKMQSDKSMQEEVDNLNKKFEMMTKENDRLKKALENLEKK